MTRSAHSRWALLLAASALLAPLTGCTGGPDDEAVVPDGASAVTADELAAAVANAFDGQDVVVDAGSLACPQDLSAAKGQEVRCQFRSDRQPVEAVVTVTGADGDGVTFDVTTAALPVPAARVQEVVAEQLTAQGASVDGVTCAGDLPPENRATTTCQVAGGGTTYAVTVTASGVDGGVVGYEITAA